mgnify:FL=1
MSLLLCRQEPVETPYYVEALGIHLYSSQELCYVIYHHPLLVMEDFVDDRLIGFLRSELRMPFLAERIEKWLESRGASDELLFLIPQDCAYYSPNEQTLFRQKVTAYRKLPEEEYEKARADYFYRIRLYGKAISVYERILEADREKKLSGSFRAKIWNNIASCYTKLFCYQKAMHAYDCAWDAEESEEFIKRMYLLTVMEPMLEVKEKYLSMMTEDKREEWDQLAEAAAAESEQEEPVRRMEKLFQKDPIKRMAGAGDVLNRWKVEYRRMI